MENLNNNLKYLEYLQSNEWKNIAKKRMSIDKYACQCCGCKGTANNPLEIHHLSYRAIFHEEERIQEDLVTLCHVCHKGIHNVMNRVTDVKTGRRGWKDNNSIPTIHAFNIGGYLTYLEEQNND